MTSPKEEENLKKIKMPKHDNYSFRIKNLIVINLDDVMDEMLMQMIIPILIILMIVMQLLKSIMTYPQYFPKH